MAKPKIDFKDQLLKKGEYAVLGAAGVGLVLLLVMGVSKYGAAKDPKAISQKLTSKAQSIDQMIAAPADDGAVPPLEDWAKPNGKNSGAQPVPPTDFVIATPPFDPVAKPDTKRENPKVLTVGDYQVDLVRAPMKAFDLVYEGDGTAKVAVLVPKKKGDLDKQKLRDIAKAITSRGKQGVTAATAPPVAKGPTPPGGPMGPPQAGGPPGIGIGPPGGTGSPEGGGAIPAGPRGGLGGGGEGGYMQAGMRTENVLTYIPLDDLDRAMGEGKVPAMTVIPTRMVVVNAAFPLKAQAEELRKALRLPPGTKEQPFDVTPFVKFDGFKVKRRVIGPDGVIDGIDKKYADVAGTSADKNGGPDAGWYVYNYEARYQALVASRSLVTHPEGADPNDKTGHSPYLPYFYRYEDKMVMALPALVPELGKYPSVTLPSIKKTIDEMKKLTAPKVDQSEILKRLGGKNKDGAGIFTPATGAETGGTLYGVPGGLTGSGGETAKKGGEAPMIGGQAAPAGVTIDDILIRFVDPDVRPGMTYEYMIQVRLVNPNYGKEQEKFMAIPSQARIPVLEGPWTRLNQPLTVPAESYLFAYDTKKYQDGLEKAYGKNTPLYRRFDLPPGNTHAVVQKVQWLEQVRVSGTQREPVGAWVAAEMPVARGGLVGRKTYVKLPLWSSEDTRYTLREVATEKLAKGKDTQPKGWLVDFAGRDILVDFDGGKVATRVGSATREEDVQTELLIVRPDGRLVVRSSAADDANPTRLEATADFANWVQGVEASAAPAAGTGGMFERPMP
jgi:hypothetical protein